MPSAATPSRSPVLFIGGIGRSGTTVFELSLATDPRTVSLGELTHLWERSLIWDELCGCGEPFSRCPFWQDVGEAAFGGWNRVDAHQILRMKREIDRSLRTPQLALRIGGRGFLQRTAEYASHYAKIYRGALDVSGAQVVIDSSKQASLPYVLRYSPEVDLRVIHCVRDSRAVAYSWTKKVVRPEARSADANYMTTYRPATLGLKWMQHNLVIEALRGQGIPTMRLRYEDWATDPAGAAMAALAHAGLEERPNPFVSMDSIELGVSHTCSGNPMRFSTGKISIRTDNKWVSELPQRSKYVVSALTAPGLLAYGYVRRRK